MLNYSIKQTCKRRDANIKHKNAAVTIWAKIYREAKVLQRQKGIIHKDKRANPEGKYS